MGTTSLFRAVLAGLALGVSVPAFAQDDDFDFGDLDEDNDNDAQEDKAKPVEDDGEIDDSDPDDDEWIVEPEQDSDKELEFEDDLLEDDGEDVGTRGPGEDTARIYREELEDNSRLGPDEEALAWERYMRKYPNSIFQARVETRLDELNQELYEGRLDASYQRTGDAGNAEILFSQPLQLENIDPRSKIRAGFEWGIPNYINLMADIEYQLLRELSAHVGLRRRFTGWNLEAGARYALVKSARTNLLVTAIGDFRMNLDPAFPAFRPQLGIGKRFEFGNVGMDVNLQGGSDLAFIRDNAGDLSFSPRAVGGVNIMVIPTETVRAYVETSTYMKGFGQDRIEPFAFNQLSIGIKFIGRKSKTEERYDAGLGATVPYKQNYWGYHNGSVAGDLNFFL
jgi:hypothetical protein